GSLFFFSSRRRHTRFSRDWSSDVCSSDLPVEHLPAGEPEQAFAGRCDRKHPAPGIVGVLVIQQHDIDQRMVEFVDMIEIDRRPRSEEHTSELQSRENLVCRLLLEKKKTNQ